MERFDARNGDAWALPARYAGVSALAGVVLGFCEAFLLTRKPLEAGLLKPNVGPAIWFVGPLADGTLAGLVGCAIGCLIAKAKRTQSWGRISRNLRQHRVAIAVIAVCAAIAPAANHLGGSPHPWHTVFVGAVIAVLISAFVVVGSRLHGKILGTALAGATALLLAGLAGRSTVTWSRGTTFEKSPAGAKAPNIILITLDTVRADHLSLYGYSRPTSPNLSRWARQGAVFENAIAASSWTLPSHASMLTGALPHQHAADWSRPMCTDCWTVAELLKAHGYTTAGFSSNYWYGMGAWGMDAGFEVYDDDSTSIGHNLRSLLLGRALIQPIYHRVARPDFLERRDAHQLNREVLRWFDSKRLGPYFLFINYYDAHDPYLPPAPFKARFGAATAGVVERTLPAFQTGSLPPVSAQDRQSLIDSYDNCLASLDESVAQLLDSLARAPDWENTVVIITSDHGDSFGEHGTYGHGLNLYREVLHVPLVIFGGDVPKGVRVSQLVATQDLFSTMLQLAGNVLPAPYDGGLSRYWRHAPGPSTQSECVVSELLPKYPSADLHPLIKLTTPEWAYLRNSLGGAELYHLPTDPAERTNLADAPEYRRLTEALNRQLCELVGNSLRPWRMPEYLSALGRPASMFAALPTVLAATKPLSHPLPREIDDVLEVLPPKAPTARGAVQPSDADLLHSLPYQ